MPPSVDNKTEFDSRYQTEQIGFETAELQPCDTCGRANSPDRLKCLYCGNELKMGTAEAACTLTLPRLEPWEKGWNVVATACSSDAKSDAVADVLSLEGEQTAVILAVGRPLPIARTKTRAESEILLQQLGAMGVTCRIVSDESLDPETLPTRLAGMEFADEAISLRNFNTRESTAFRYDEITIIVTGALMHDRTDVLEKKGRRGSSKVLDEMQTSADEAVVDIYTRDDAKGYRINLAGFDFSCLGDAMGLYAAENIRSLVATLHTRCPAARVVDDYSRIRHLLDPVWEVEVRKDSQGLQRAGFGKVEFGSTASTSNLRQFTKYSRLQWQLL